MGTRSYQPGLRGGPWGWVLLVLFVSPAGCAESVDLRFLGGPWSQHEVVIAQILEASSANPLRGLTPTWSEADEPIRFSLGARGPARALIRAFDGRAAEGVRECGVALGDGPAPLPEASGWLVPLTDEGVGAPEPEPESSRVDLRFATCVPRISPCDELTVDLTILTEPLAVSLRQAEWLETKLAVSGENDHEPTFYVGILTPEGEEIGSKLVGPVAGRLAHADGILFVPTPSGRILRFSIGAELEELDPLDLFETQARVANTGRGALAYSPTSTVSYWVAGPNVRAASVGRACDLFLEAEGSELCLGPDALFERSQDGDWVESTLPPNSSNRRMIYPTSRGLMLSSDGGSFIRQSGVWRSIEAPESESIRAAVEVAGQVVVAGTNQLVGALDQEIICPLTETLLGAHINAFASLSPNEAIGVTNASVGLSDARPRFVRVHKRE
ncbi:MAG: hypothetical protein HY791_37695 [Deltaproteobacteria bacterium]|nr:hypothetical protein [Deltaproteobacteria bacterium]